MENKTNAERVEYRRAKGEVIPVYADQIIDQPESYRAEDHEVWEILISRQKKYIQNQASSLFIKALNNMPFEDNKIPRFTEINKVLEEVTGWNIVAVNGLLSDVAFFDLLAHKKFPVTWWIRKKSQIEYIQEPDLFHDLFGHVPLLWNKEYSDVMEAFGRAGAATHQSNPDFMERLGRLYWFTIEFGLIMEGVGGQSEERELRAFGAGLLSSGGEISHALGPDPQRKPFNLHNIIRTAYRIDTYQPIYYVMESFIQIKKGLLEYESMYKEA